MMNPVVMTILFVTLLSTFTAHAGEVDPAAIIAAHNKWRAEAGVAEELSYSPALALSAQAWVDHLKYANHCRMRHSETNGQYGENLYWASAVKWSNGKKEMQQVSPEAVVDSWGKERANYDYAKNRCKPGTMCGHYTQIVWRTTSAVGCGSAVCEGTNEQVWACQYLPAGNWVGRGPTKLNANQGYPQGARIFRFMADTIGSAQLARHGNAISTAL